MTTEEAVLDAPVAHQPAGRFAMYKKQDKAVVHTAESIRKRISKAVVVPRKIEQEALRSQARAAASKAKRDLQAKDRRKEQKKKDRKKRRK